MHGLEKTSNPWHPFFRQSLVEDNPEHAQLLLSLLKELGEESFDVDCAPSLGEAIQYLETQPCDAIVLDLTLPDSDGLQTLLKLRARFPNRAVIVLTGNADSEMAAQAVREGAQDYLVKASLGGNRELLNRTIRFGIERQKLLESLHAREQEIRDHEKQSFERMSQPESLAARIYAAKPLVDTQPGAHKELVRDYLKILKLSLEKQAYRVDHDLTHKARDLAGRVGALHGGPRDLIRIHMDAIKLGAKNATPERIKAYTDHGSMTVLEIMGYLAAYYRNYSFAAWQIGDEIESPDATPENTS